MHSEPPKEAVQAIRARQPGDKVGKSSQLECGAGHSTAATRPIAMLLCFLMEELAHRDS